MRRFITCHVVPILVVIIILILGYVWAKLTMAYESERTYEVDQSNVVNIHEVKNDQS